MRVYVCYCSCHMKKGWLGISLTRKCFAYRNWIVTSHGVNFLPPQPFSFSRQFAFSNTYLCIYLFICDLEYILYIIIIIVALSRLIRHFVLQAQFSLLFPERTTIILRGNCVFLRFVVPFNDFLQVFASEWKVTKWNIRRCGFDATWHVILIKSVFYIYIYFSYLHIIRLCARIPRYGKTQRTWAHIDYRTIKSLLLFEFDSFVWNLYK